MGTTARLVEGMLEDYAAVVVVIDGLYVATPHRDGVRVTADTGGYGDASGDVVVKLRHHGHGPGYAVTDYRVQTPGLVATMLDVANLGWDDSDEDHDALLDELEAAFGGVGSV